MAASASGGAESLEARRWRPLRELGKVCFNERCAARSKGRFRASGDPGPVSPGGTTDNTPRVGKHPAPSGALRPVESTGFKASDVRSGSTQHHQVH